MNGAYPGVSQSVVSIVVPYRKLLGICGLNAEDYPGSKEYRPAKNTIVEQLNHPLSLIIFDIELWLLAP